MRGHEHIRHGDKATSRLAPKGDDGRFDLFVAMHGRSDRVTHAVGGRDPRERLPRHLHTHDIYIPDLHLDTVES